MITSTNIPYPPAQSAVYTLLGLKLAPPAVYKGIFDPRVLFKAFVALHDLAS